MGGVWRPARVALGDVLGVAAGRAAGMPVYRLTMRGVPANEVGATGEVVAMKFLRGLGLDVVDDPDVGGDLWVGGQRVEVKTKERSVSPRGSHACSVPDYNHEVQVPDWFVFVSLLSDGSAGVGRFRGAWVCGAITDSRLRSEGRLWLPGEVDSNGWSPTIPVWNVPVSSLCDPAVLGATVTR